PEQEATVRQPRQIASRWLEAGIPPKGNLLCEAGGLLRGRGDLFTGAAMHSLIHWWSRNRIAANFLMWALIAFGIVAWYRQRKEIFPEVSTNFISITVLYPNAAPEEVETGVCIPIEEAIAAVDGIKQITSRAGENVGIV